MYIIYILTQRNILIKYMVSTLWTYFIELKSLLFLLNQIYLFNIKKKSDLYNYVDLMICRLLKLLS